LVTTTAQDPALLEALERTNSSQENELPEFDVRVRTLLYEDKFDELEDLAAAIRSKPDLLDGSPRMHCFYEAMLRNYIVEQDLVERLEHLDEWHKAIPHSPIPEIAASRIWLDMARSIRERATRPLGEADQRLVNERVTRAHAYIMAALRLRRQDPELYVPYLTLAAMQEWSPAQIDTVFDEAMKLDPHYAPVHLTRASIMLPGRGGNKGDIERLASDIRNRLGGQKGDIAYAQIALVALRDDPHQYNGHEFKPEVLKPSLIAYCREYAGSRWMVQEACHLACMSNDIETARAIFDQIPLGDSENVIWSSSAKMEEWRSKVNAQSARHP